MTQALTVIGIAPAGFNSMRGRGVTPLVKLRCQNADPRGLYPCMLSGRLRDGVRWRAQGLLSGTASQSPPWLSNIRRSNAWATAGWRNRFGNLWGCRIQLCCCSARQPGVLLIGVRNVASPACWRVRRHGSRELAMPSRLGFRVVAVGAAMPYLERAVGALRGTAGSSVIRPAVGSARL